MAMNVAVGTGWTSLNISETPDLLDFLDFLVDQKRENIKSFREKCFIDARGQRIDKECL